MRRESSSFRARGDFLLSIGICLSLAVAIVASYGPIDGAAFINFDDHEYVYENAHVISGLTWENVAWAFTTTHLANWHPLTWLSHMLDCELFGLDAGAHHRTNLLLHIANTLLLFFVLREATRSPWRSAFVAALFALHPLHVESVAWVSERKDVLSTFFWMLTIGSYLRYARAPSVVTYLPVVLFFALGLMSKPMLVTLPFTLLLFDFWPLRRIEIGRSSVATGAARRKLSALVREKVPLLLLSGISSAVTFWVQRNRGAVRSLEELPFDARAANATISYVRYIFKMFWPEGLAIHYPHPGFPSLWALALAAALLVAISLLVLRTARGRPALVVGWLWYVGTILPVIGLVQVGSQAMADRYTYVPLIGLFIMLAWGIPEPAADGRRAKLAVAVGAAASLTALSLLTRMQVGYWQDSIRLFEHALEVTRGNVRAHTNLGLALGKEGRLADAMTQHEATLRIDPSHETALYEMGILFERMGRMQEATRAYAEAVRLHPDHVRARNNLAALLFRSGRIEAAVAQLREAQRVDPSDALVRGNLEKIEALQHRAEAWPAPDRRPPE